jgi:uncharacterized membrane protein (DUF2068 family)
VINWIRRLGRRFRGAHWHPETFVCSRRGHVLPAAGVRTLRPQDAGVGVDLPDGRRLARCLRCDSWREVPPPGADAAATLPPLAEIAIPRRGAELEEAIILRVIAIDRIVHVILFGLLAALGLWLLLRLGGLQHQATDALDGLRSLAASSTVGSHGLIVAELQHVLNLREATLRILVATSLAYFVLELVEAVGLWHERRWAEYLTAVAIAGLLPFEIVELTRRITVFRLGALAINLAILVWLLWRKRLFGLNGGRAATRHEAPDPEVLLAAPGAAPSEVGPGEGARPGVPTARL